MDEIAADACDAIVEFDGAAAAIILVRSPGRSRCAVAAQRGMPNLAAGDELFSAAAEQVIGRAIASQNPIAFDVRSVVGDVDWTGCDAAGYRRAIVAAIGTWGALVMLRADTEQADAMAISGEQVAAAGLASLLYLARLRVTEGARLRDGHKVFRRVLGRFPIAAVVHSAGTVVYANEAMHQLLECTPGQKLVGAKLLDAGSTSAAERTLRELSAITETSNHFGPVVGRRLVRSGGATVLVEALSVPVEFDAAAATLTLARDVGDRQRRLGEMMLLDRLQAVGTLAAGVGNAINNPLAYVLADIEHVTTELRGLAAKTNVEARATQLAHVELSDLIDALDEAEDGVLRVRDIVRDLRSFSQGESEEMGAVRLDRLIDVAVTMTKNELRSRARVMMGYQGDLVVRGSESRLLQLIVNLIMNAAEAIGQRHAGDGRVDSDNEIQINAYRRGEHVLLEVEDTGRAIAADELDNMFDPFFTLPVAGTARGLGLFVCRTVAEAHGGALRLECCDGRGMRAIVELPAFAGERAAVYSPPQAADAPAAQDRLRILVIDDEPVVLRTLIRILGREHQVETTTSAADALARLSAGERFDVVLCDLVMPHISGVEFHRRLQERDPALAEQIIFLTGGAYSESTERFLDEIQNPRVEKPFDVDSIRSIVHVRGPASSTH